ncbi:Hypothetical protein FKW44_022349 [Caligus rogercresseyi]|uniref:Uncharacterized protein n=1 Tax=Caligus rogercresseyi TaxID=217165 RepID=A0A7T8GT42_CALRO|nr:Hypothetical protein FKW44_022349 [Caligus rogercresseyi]
MTGFLSKKKEDIPVQLRTSSEGKSHPQSWSGGSDVGREEGPNYLCRGGVKIDQAVYLHFLSEEVVPCVQREYPTALFLFQQDEAPSHTSKWFKASALIYRRLLVQRLVASPPPQI